MEIGFAESLLLVGLLLAVAASLSGLMRGTVLSISVLAVATGIVLAVAGVIDVDAGDPGVAKLLFPELSWAEAFLLGAVLAPTDPVVTSAVLTARRVPVLARHTLNLESGLNDGLALPFVLFFLIWPRPAPTRAARR